MLLAFLSAMSLTTNTSVSLSDGPATTSLANYQNNRAPLAQTKFIKLPVGAVKPRGWLKEQLVRQRNGLNGNLGQISAWLQKKDNAWLSKDGSGKWGWEEVPYWLKGYADMGYILGDKEVIEETQFWIEAVFASRRPDGNFGPVGVDDKGVEDFWPKMIMLYCLESYYDQSKDPRVIELMTGFFKYQLAYPEDKFMQQYWQSRRTGDNLHSVLWLYNQTGEAWLLDLAHKIHKRGVDWGPKSVSSTDWFQAMPDWHNVNIAQGFREPAQYSVLTKDKKDIQKTYDAFNFVRKHFGQVPGGMFGADENAREGFADPRQGVETCGLVEQINSDQDMLQITGDAFWGDHIEDVAFNTLPAAYMPDMRTLRYLTAPNMVLSDDANHSPGIQNAGPFLMMNPFSSRCCQHNHGMGWPYLIKNLFMATSDAGVVAAVYAPSEATIKVSNGVNAKIGLKTKYPFEDQLAFSIDPDSDVEFPFYLRVPAWCKNPSVRVNGAEVKADKGEGAYLKVARTWKKGDKVVLTLPMQVTTRTWAANKDSVSVDYGPLTFSLKIGENYRVIEGTKATQWDSKWQEGADTTKWPAYVIEPTTDWNFGLLQETSFKVIKKPWPKDNYPFSTGSAPISILAQGRQIPLWRLDENLLCGVLPMSPVETDEPVRQLELIPMGAARLRISAFPVVIR